MQNCRTEDKFCLFHNFSIGKHLHGKGKAVNAICFVIVTGGIVDGLHICVYSSSENISWEVMA